MRNNMPMAILGGALAAVIGAGIWAGVTISTGYQIGWIAVGIGILVGFAVRLMGGGNTVVFSVIGAVFALVGCLLGNLLSGIGFIAAEYQIGYMAALKEFDYSESFELLKAMFSPIDLLFYGIAIWEGFKFATVPDQHAITSGETH